jgi:histidine triad (HIT) family protein
MDDCLFCKIVSGEIRSDCVFEDEEVYAFRDINPQAPTHVLIVPKKHIPSVAALTGDDAAICGRVVVVAASLAQTCGVADRGFRLVFNCGEDGGQSVGHLHLHLLAGRKLGWPPG